MTSHLVNFNHFENVIWIMEVWSYWKCFDGKDLRKVVVMENMSEFRRTKLILPAGLFTKP